MPIQCPNLPLALADGLPPAGSVEWCLWLDGLLQFFADLGKIVGKWLDGNLNWQSWHNQLTALQKSVEASKATGSTIFANIVAWFIQILDIIGKGIDVLKDVVACAWNLRKLLLPRHHPEAYLGVLLIRQVLDSIASWNIGINWPVRGTGTVHISIPAIDQLVDALLRYLLPIEMPSAGEATQAWSHGLIDTAARDCVWSYWGHDPKGYERYILAQTPALSATQAIEWSRRLGAGDGVSTAEAMIRAGVIDPIQRRRLEGLYDRLESQGEALEWERRALGNVALGNSHDVTVGWDAYWAAHQESFRSQGVTIEVARQNYEAHWTQVGRGELEQMVHRLRPGAPGVRVPLTVEQYRLRLTGLGYLPADVDDMTAILYRPLSPGDALDLYRRGGVDLRALSGAYLDAGYGNGHAKTLTERDMYATAQWRANTYGGWTPQSAGKAYAIGLLTSDQVTQILTPLGGTASDVQALEQRSTADYQYRVLSRAISRVLSTTLTTVKQSMQAGIMDVAGATTALTSAGYPRQQAAGIASLAATAGRTALIRSAVRKLKSAYLAGEVTGQYATGALHQLGVVPSAITQYMALWGIENTPQRKRRSASQIVNDMAEGVMSIADGTSRLNNLGYDGADISLYIADAQRKQVTTAPARAEAQALFQAAGRGAQAAQTSYLPGLSKRAIAELRAQESPSMLASYLHNGLISEAYATNRLLLYGWQQHSIDTWIEAARMKTVAATAAPAPLPTEDQSNANPVSG